MKSKNYLFKENRVAGTTRRAELARQLSIHGVRVKTPTKPGSCANYTDISVLSYFRRFPCPDFSPSLSLILASIARSFVT